LREAGERAVAIALEAAWRKRVPKQLAATLDRDTQTTASGRSRRPRSAPERVRPMYSVDDRDQVAEPPDIPQSSVGAPLPLVVADEQHVLLAYLVEVKDASWNGTTVRVVTNRSPEPVALVEFTRPRAHYLGPANDEAFDGHPLAARGLEPYGAFEVRESSWIRELERRNRVHPNNDAGRYAELRHFIFTFHDSTFECIARGLRVSLHDGPLLSVVTEMTRRLAGEQ
jgi:hypothetical protein